MKRIFGVSMAMALSLILACGALAIGFYHLEVARAEEALATFDAARADGIYARLEKTLGIGRHIPWIFDGVREDLQVRRSRLSYWRQDYAAVLKETADRGKMRRRSAPLSASSGRTPATVPSPGSKVARRSSAISGRASAITQRRSKPIRRSPTPPSIMSSW